jgi:hypothetical protein
MLVFQGTLKEELTLYIPSTLNPCGHCIGQVLCAESGASP